MRREVLSNGLVKLTGENGIIDTRTENVYSIVIVNKNKERYFKDNEGNNENV